MLVKCYSGYVCERILGEMSLEWEAEESRRSSPEWASAPQ